jgi:hypothetical protein
MNGQGQIPRSRGGVCGALLILLGLWGGLAPFVGPYFHFGFTPDATWHYDSGRLYYSIIPGAAALLGGVLVAGTRNRGVGVTGGVLAALGGAWFVAGAGVVTYVLKKTISAGSPVLTTTSGAQPLALRPYLETISLFTGLGILVLFVGATAVGRFSMLAASDLAAGVGADSYDAEFPAAPAASQPDLSPYATTVGQFGTAPDSPFPGDPRPFPGDSRQAPVTDQYAPPQYPDTTTSHFPPPESAR